MVRYLILLWSALITFGIPLCWAGRVLNVDKSNQIEVESFPGDEIEMGSLFYLLDETGNRRGLVKVTGEVRGNVQAELLKGRAGVGWMLQKKSSVSDRTPANGDSGRVNEGEREHEKYSDTDEDEDEDKGRRKRRRGRPRDDNFSLMIWPLFTLLGWNHIGIDYAMADKATIGLIYETCKTAILGMKYDCLAYGIDGKYYINSFALTDSWVLMASVGSASSSVVIPIVNNSYKATGTYYGIGLAYYWFWETFHMGIGSRSLNSSIPKTEKQSDGSTISRGYLAGQYSTFEFSMGWKF
jgi:hypothetical protein